MENQKFAYSILLKERVILVRVNRFIFNLVVIHTISICCIFLNVKLLLCTHVLLMENTSTGFSSQGGVVSELVCATT